MERIVKSFKLVIEYCDDGKGAEFVLNITNEEERELMDSIMVHVSGLVANYRMHQRLKHDHCARGGLDDLVRRNLI
jgi:hypothetical protein